MSSPRVAKETLPYPAFPKKGLGKGRRAFPLEEVKNFKSRVEIMAAYLRSLTKIAAKFKDGRKHFMYNGQKVDRRAVNNLFSQLGSDIRDLHGYFKMARAKPRSTRTGGFALPSIASNKMLDFLRGANLGPAYNKDGTQASPDLKAALAFLNDQNYVGIVGGGGLMALFAIYARINGLTAQAMTNREKAAAGQKLDGNWLGVDQNVADTFAGEIQTGIAKGQQQLVQEQAAGGGIGQPRKFRSGGRPAKPAKPGAGGSIRETQKFYPFDPNNFRWSDVSSVFVTPNISKDTFRSVNPNADLFFPPSGVTADQASQIAAYDDAVRTQQSAGLGDVDHLELARQASGASSKADVFTRNAPLFARAQNSGIQQYISNSKEGLKAALKAQGQA